MAPRDKQGPLELGGKFLKYTVRELLGRGGHAWVYAGHDQFLDVEVAIKILHRPGGVTRDMLRRGQAEAKLLYRLKHPNIVDVLDAGVTQEGLLYIVMELLRGSTLRELLVKKRRLTLTEALPLFAKISDGVEAAHQFKAIHRDLKPENIFVLADSEPKVLDFGIAKVVDAAGWTTDKDIVHGTVLYMAPEQLNGETATARSDVYALGLTLFEALQGRHPLLLKNERPTMQELSWMQHAMRPPRLDQLDPSIPRYVARLVEWMLFKAPDRRVASMRECGKALRECVARWTNADASGEFASVSLRTDAPNAPPLAIASLAPEGAIEEVHDTERIAVSFTADDSVTLPRASRAIAAGDQTDRIESQREARLTPAVAPVTTGVAPAAVRRSERLADDPYRKLVLRLLFVSCLGGAALGLGYLALSGTFPSRASGAKVAGTTLPPRANAAAGSAVPSPPKPSVPSSAASVAIVPPLQASARAAPPVASTAKPRTAKPAAPKPRKAARRDNELWVDTTSPMF